MKKTIYILGLILLFSCIDSNDTKKSPIKEANNNKIKIIKKQREQLKNRIVHSINKQISDIPPQREYIILLYNGFDCYSCIKKGFQIIKKVNSTNPGLKSFVIASSTNIGSDQIKYSYKEHIYYDNHDDIRKELKYIYTPVIIHLNSKSKIKKVFYPGIENKDNKQKFVNYLLNLK